MEERTRDRAGWKGNGDQEQAAAWPDGKRFAFTIFDDTDNATIGNTAPVYRMLEELDIRTTKSVWPLRGEYATAIGGSTCEEQEYLEWILELQRKGFDIGFHGATCHSSVRERARAAVEKFSGDFGHPPAAYANHSENADALYWGPHRFTGVNKVLYNMLTRGRRRGKYDGHIEESPHFWGDLCRENVKYVRDFVFTDINTLKACPQMPYHDPERPYVNYWFAGSEGADVGLFNRTIAEEHQDRLEEEGGACIMYTHFASGFVRDGRIDPRFAELMRRLSRKQGWFVPVPALLDHLLAVKGHRELSLKERTRIERRFLWDRTKLRLLTRQHQGNFASGV